jgi:hypothetical protein
MVVGLYQPLADDDRGTPSSDQTCLLQSLQKTKKNARDFPNWFFFGLSPAQIKARERPATEAAGLKLRLGVT